MRVHMDTVICVAFRANDELIVTASHDGSFIRRTRSHEEQMEPIMHSGFVRHQTTVSMII